MTARRPASWIMARQLILGAMLVAMFAYGIVHALTAYRTARLPAGWTTLMPGMDVTTLARVGTKVWAGGAGGLAVFAETGERVDLPVALKGLSLVAGLLVDPDDGLWIAHEAGLAHWREGTLTQWGLDAGRFPGRVLALHRDHAGTLWVGHEQGLARWMAGRFESVMPSAGIDPGPVDAIHGDRQGVLWLGDASPRSQGLLAIGPDGVWHRYTRAHGLPHHSVNAFGEDDAGNLWVGTGFAGMGAALVIGKAGWRVLGRADGLAGEKVRSIYLDSRNRLWLGSEYDGVAIRAGTETQILDETKGLAGREVKVVLEYPPDTFWLGTTHGITRIAGFTGRQAGS